MKTIKAAFVRNHIAETWAMARKEPVLVENHGEPEFVILSASEYVKLTQPRAPRQAGYAKHLFAGIDVDEMLNTPVPGIEDYMPQ